MPWNLNRFRIWFVLPYILYCVIIRFLLEDYIFLICMLFSGSLIIGKYWSLTACDFISFRLQTFMSQCVPLTSNNRLIMAVTVQTYRFLCGLLTTWILLQLPTVITSLGQHILSEQPLWLATLLIQAATSTSVALPSLSQVIKSHDLPLANKYRRKKMRWLDVSRYQSTWLFGWLCNKNLSTWLAITKWNFKKD